jgi:hypothetical protein
MLSMISIRDPDPGTLPSPRNPLPSGASFSPFFVRPARLQTHAVPKATETLAQIRDARLASYPLLAPLTP